MRRLTMEEILAKFIDEDRREHEKMKIFIKEFRTTNELLLKTRSNLLSELKIEVNESSKVVSNVLIPKNKVKGVKTKGGKMKSEATRSKKISETGINKNEPPRFEQDVLKEACTETMNERCSAVLLNELPSKEKDPGSFTTPCQVFEKPKEAEHSAAEYLSRLFPQIGHLKKGRDFSRKSRLTSERNLMHLNCARIIMKRYMAGSKTLEILAHCHLGPTCRHHSANVTAKKVYESRFYWPSIFKDVNEYVRRCDARQRLRNISSRNEMPQNNIQGCEVFDVWGLDFMRPFLQSRGNEYILLDVDYVSKWVKAQALPMNDAHVVVKFLSQLFARFGVPKALISDIGTYFCNSQLEKALQNMVGPNIVKMVYPYGAIEITDRDEFSFKVNGQRLKKYYGGNFGNEDDEVLEFEDGVT
nr:reverse transcriptase domain-containing protein [Tanacetum cinerariifolium]